MLTSPDIVDHLEPVELVPVGDSAEPDAPLSSFSSSSVSPSSSHPSLSSESGDDILVFTIHDGSQVPRHLWGDRSEEVLARDDVRRAYVRERDWGANTVAEQIARRLGLKSYLRVNLARFILDFGRFPGTSAVGEGYLTRHSMFPPVEHLLSQDAIHEVIHRYYDEISRVITQHFASKRITLAIHTYDPFNHTGTERPRFSLVSRSLSYQNDSSIPPYVFDPLFPSILCEATSDRALTYQILLDLEKAGHHTALNYPYVMPEGSVEIRAQVWFFFRHLRRHFTARYPHTAELAPYQRVWQMMLDVSRRSGECERLRAFLHRYRAAPSGLETLFADARKAYGHIQEFLSSHRGILVEEYRYAPDRPSCLGVEVRKDQLCWIDPELGNVEPQADAAAFAAGAASIFAGSVLEYVRRKNQRADQQQAPLLSDPMASAASSDSPQH